MGLGGKWLSKRRSLIIEAVSLTLIEPVISKPIGARAESGDGEEYLTIGLRVIFDDLGVAEANLLIRRIREGDSEVWVRNCGSSNDFQLNTINPQLGNEKVIVERLKELIC